MSINSHRIYENLTSYPCGGCRGSRPRDQLYAPARKYSRPLSQAT